LNPSEATVVVIDDDPEVRAALTRLLRSVGWNVAAYGGAREYLAAAPDTRAGCILLDVSMPEVSGPELHEQLREHGVTLPVIYLTGGGSVAAGVRAMKRGAVDFLEKPIDAETLLPAISEAIARHRQQVERQDRLGEVRQRYASLSPRERDVLAHVVTGRLNKVIAADLGIAEKTVKVHRGRVMEKMGVRSVAELVHLCTELGLAREP
jgi:FixJ family two-component response regulator